MTGKPPTNIIRRDTALATLLKSYHLLDPGEKRDLKELQGSTERVIHETDLRDLEDLARPYT